MNLGTNPLLPLLIRFTALFLLGLNATPGLAQSDISIVPSKASSATQSSPTALPRVVVLVFQPSDDETLLIVENMQSRMFEVDVKFGVRWVKPPIAAFEEQLVHAKKFLTDEKVDLVIFWHSFERDILYYVLPNEKIPLEREIITVAEISRPAAMAIIARTAVESLLDSEKLRSSHANGQIHPSLTPPAPPQQKTPQRSFPQNSRTAPLVLVQAGYQLTIPRGAPTLVHSGMFRFNLQPLSFLRGFVGIGVSSHLESQEAGIKMEQSRVPMEIGLLGVFRRKKMTFGGGSAFVFVPTKNVVHSDNDAAVVTKPYWSNDVMFKFVLEAQYQFYPRLSFYGDFFLLVRPNMISYEVQDGPVLFDEYRRIWPGLQVGMTVSLF